MKKHLNRQPLFKTTLFCIMLLMATGIFTILKTDFIWFGCAEILLGFVLFFFTFYANRQHKKDMTGFLKLITDQNNTMANDAISRLPIPTVILRIDGQILWYNDLFSQICENEDLYSVQISSVMPDLRWSEILKSSEKVDMYATYRSRHYHVLGNIICSKSVTDENGQPVYSVLLYFMDQTETERLRYKYEEEKTDVVMINIDNYDELIQKMDDELYQQTLSAIGRCVSQWVSESKGVVKKTERDRYLVLFEHQYLKKYIRNKFDILDKVRAIGEDIKMPITLSIGIGTGGHLSENEGYARSALDLALGRGGDQVSVKDEIQYTFYGGQTKDYEKSTRVKTRSFANALKDFILHADNVILIGHSNADYDSFGAALGLQRAVRAFDKKPYIVLDHSPAVELLLAEAKQCSEYEGMIITPSVAAEIVTKDTLVIVLDTHRPSMLPYPELLKKATKIVLIDHHRRSTEFIENSALTYHEPYASSTCEMITEIMQYIDAKCDMTAFEAMALYVGILMDTKNFITKTGVRTFEAASYLRRYGLNTATVKRMFNIDRDDYMHRLEIVQKNQLYCNHFAIAVCDTFYPNMRVISSQAADEMLNIADVKAAFVIYPMEDNSVFVSARSLGEVNVQVIMERLGGGGHMTVAGAQIQDTTVADTKEVLEDAIWKYQNEQ